jgi:putative CocE/NonD family hydrolase
LIYDPRHPAPTIGGRYGMGGWSPNCAQDQVCSRAYFGCENDLPLNQRADVLSFVGKPLDRPVEVTGPVLAKLWVSSDARDTDVMVKLVDVYPNGYAMLLSVGQLRMRYRDGYSRAALMKPGERYQVGVELGSVSNLFAAEHRIRVDITSSDYPRLEPNPNTGKAIGTSSDPVVAKNTVHFSAKQPSRIELPVITR